MPDPSPHQETVASATTHPWPSMRGNARNDGCRLEPYEALAESTIRHIPTGNAVFSTPIIGAGECIYVGSADQKFYAIDAQTGEIDWIFAMDGVIDSAACIDQDGNIYVPCGDARLYKLSSTGKQLWALDLLSRRYPTSSTIYWWEGNVTMGPNGLLYAGNDDFCLYAITPEGEIRWLFLTGLQIWSAPAFGNGLVYFGSFDMYMYALEQATGGVRWKKRLGNFIASSPAIGPTGDIYVGCFSGEVYALDGASGAIRWRVQTNGSIYASPAIAEDGTLYIGSEDGNLYRIDTKTGEVLWTFAVGSPIWSSCSIGTDPERSRSYLVYVGTSGGRVIAVDAHGQCRWRYDTPTPSDVIDRGSVNASIALGRYGLATASTSGDILYIPYDAYLHTEDKGMHHTTERTPDTVQQERHAKTMMREAAANGEEVRLETGTHLRVTKMTFTNPAIINPLDQIGIASLVIDMVIVDSNPDTGKFVAWGMQAFGRNEAGNPVGTPYPRSHVFAFNGRIVSGVITLEATICDFEITAFPIPLDKLSLVALRHGEDWKGISLRAELECQHLARKIVQRYGSRLVHYAGVQFSSLFGASEFSMQVRSAWRTTSALWLLFTRRLWRQWGLLDSNGNLTATGHFSIEKRTPREPRRHLELRKTTIDIQKRTITATFTIHGQGSVPSIMLIHPSIPSVVALDYGSHMRLSQKGSVLTATLRIPRSIDLSMQDLQAIVLVDREVQKKVFLTQASSSSPE